MDERPPENPDDWTDEQWLAWLEESDAAAPTAVREYVEPSWKSKGAATQMMAASMIGLARAIYGPAKSAEIVVVQDEDGDPGDSEEAIELEEDPDDPDLRRVIIRPWLFNHDEET